MTPEIAPIAIHEYVFSAAASQASPKDTIRHQFGHQKHPWSPKRRKPVTSPRKLHGKPRHEDALKNFGNHLVRKFLIEHHLLSLICLPQLVQQGQFFFVTTSDFPHEAIFPSSRAHISLVTSPYFIRHDSRFPSSRAQISIITSQYFLRHEPIFTSSRPYISLVTSKDFLRHEPIFPSSRA